MDTIDNWCTKMWTK